MKQISAYMHFNGNCREAMLFYQTCLGGELNLLSVGESPLASQFPTGMAPRILHACLTNDRLRLMGSDLPLSHEPAIGNSVSMILECSSEEEINELAASLSVGGDVLHPLENTFWGSVFGDIADQFGFHWYLNYDRKQPHGDLAQTNHLSEALA